MSQHLISANKVRRLIVLWTTTIVNKSQLADCIRISRGTARKYIVAFERSALTGNDIELRRFSKVTHPRSPELIHPLEN